MSHLGRDTHFVRLAGEESRTPDSLASELDDAAREEGKREGAGMRRGKEGGKTMIRRGGGREESERGERGGRRGGKTMIRRDGERKEY